MVMGLNLHLATVAGMAGRGARAATPVIASIGFIAALHFLRSEIIAPRQIAGVRILRNGEMFPARSAPALQQQQPRRIRPPLSKRRQRSAACFEEGGFAGRLA
jgi:hypothetical protein